jgi:hypothetical protein
MEKTLILIFGLGAAGLLSGFAAKRLSRSPADPAAQRESPSPAAKKSSPTAASAGGPVAPTPSNLRSADTLESLAAPGADLSYARLALWMLDATEQDIAAYWESVREKERTNDVTDLIFINWSRLNPQAAIAAVAGTGNEHYAWWAWACHDPKASLAAAIAANSDRVNNVAWGIGEFHGEWLRENFHLIPESGRGNAISGLTKWDDHPDPLEVLKFLQENEKEGYFRRNIFTALMRKDPWAAYDWIQQNPAAIARSYGNPEIAMEDLVKTMGEFHPEALRRLAEHSPSGEAKRKMEAVLFDNLMKTDPAAALKQAMATESPVVAAYRLSIAGLGVIQTDPEKAFEIAARLFAVNPSPTNERVSVHYPNGSSSSGYGTDSRIDEFLSTLMAKDPARVLAALPVPTEGNRESDGLVHLAAKWADQDFVGYTHWINAQTDPIVRDQAASVVISKLQEQQHFTEAAEWVLSSEKTRTGLLSLMYRWNQNHPAEAREWLENAELPEPEMKRISEFLKSNP